MYGKPSGGGGPGKLLCWAEFQVRLVSMRCNRTVPSPAQPCNALPRLAITLSNQPYMALLGVWQA